ncbi:MAG: hypothetical protein ACLFVR_15010 [Thiohalospira sp.]
MKIKKQELQTALEIVKPGLANKPIIEQATAFAFINGNVVTYNDEISISHPIQGLKIEGAIEATELYALLTKFKKDEIDVEITKSEIQFTSGRNKSYLTLQTEINLPLEEIGEIDDWKPLPETFNKHVKFAIHSCSRDMSTPILTCVHIRKDGIIEATDGFRIVNCKGKKMPVTNFLLPSSAAAEVIKLNPINIATGKGWIHFQSKEGTVISCRIFEDKYMNISQHLNVNGLELTLPKTINEMIDRVGIFAKRDYFLDESIYITIENKRIKLKAESETGRGEEEANIRYTKKEKIEFIISPYLFKDVLNETNEMIIDEKKVKFLADDWVYIIILKNK